MKKDVFFNALFFKQVGKQIVIQTDCFQFQLFKYLFLNADGFSPIHFLNNLLK